MTIHSILPIVVGSIILLFGFISIYRKSILANNIFAVGCFSIFAWLFSFAMMYSSKTEDAALFWARIGAFSVVCIPALFYHFVLVFLNRQKEKSVLFFSYIALAWFAFILLRTNYIITGLYRYPWGYYLKIPIFHSPHLLYYAILLGRSVILLYLACSKREELPPVRYNQIKYIWVFVIGSVAVIDFIPSYGIKIYPFGFIPMLLAVSILFYAIIRHRLMDINLILTKGLAYAILLLVATGIYLGLIMGSHVVVLGSIDYKSILLNLLMFLLMAIGFIYFVPKIKPMTEKVVEAVLFKNKYEYRDVLREFSRHLSFIPEQKELLDATVKKVATAMGVARVELLLQDEISGKYTLRAEVGLDEAKAKGLSLFRDKGAVAWLWKNKMTLVKEEVENILLPAEMEKINRDLNVLEASVCVPLLVENRLIGLLALSDRQSGEIFSHLDIALLESLANQLALTLGYKKLEAQMVRNEHLVQLGILASSLAHQIKNPLSSIQTFAQLLPEKYNDEEFRDEFSKIVSDDTHRITQIIDGIMELAKTREPEFISCDVNEVLKESLLLIDTKLKTSNITIKSAYGKLPEIKGDAALLREVFLNIFLNAIQAMLGAKKGDAIKISTQSEKEGVKITIEDNGPGIEKRLLSELFEPFTTTKVTGEFRGLGLGLSIVRHIIDKHQGKIDVTSEIGKGTAFFIELPYK